MRKNLVRMCLAFLICVLALSGCRAAIMDDTTASPNIDLGGDAYIPPTDPTQTETMPTQPTTNPLPTESTPTEPAPTQPTPTETTPTQPTPPVLIETPVLSHQTEEEMKQAFIALFIKNQDCTPEDINIQYLGEYDGTHTAFITTVFSDYPSMEDEEEIGGLIFRYSNGNRIMVYREGEYTRLASAYEKGWLTDEGLAKLLAYYKQLKPYLYEW